MKKAIVFGGSGFLGSHVADSLSENGYNVSIFDIRKSSFLKTGQEMIVGNILDNEAVEEAVHGCNFVYNLAGIADIDECARRPVDVVKYNILGNAIILEAARKSEVERFVFASSVYVHSETGLFYRSSKRACEYYIEDYNKAYGLPYTILRYGSLYGNRSSEHNSMYRMIKEALTKGKIEYYGTGEEIREYIHVEDAAKTSIEILDPQYENQCITLSGNQTLKYKDLLNMINEMLGGNIEIIYKNTRSDTHYLVTPYSFHPKVGRKLERNYYVDMGQGMLSIMSKIYESIHDQKED